MYQHGKESVQFIFNGLDVSLTNSNMYFERVLLVLNTVKYHLNRHL